MKQIRTRPLAIRNEGARHPFRLSLPLGVLTLTEEQEAIEDTEARQKKWLNEDASLFILSFSAFFTAFYLFIF